MCLAWIFSSSFRCCGVKRMGRLCTFGAIDCEPDALQKCVPNMQIGIFGLEELGCLG